MFCKQFLAYAVHIDWSAFLCNPKIFWWVSTYISVLTTCTFMFRQVCTIEPSFFNMTSGMHYRPFEGRHLVPYYAFPSSGEAYRDRQLTTNFELWVEIFCVPTYFHVRIPKPCLSVRTPRKEITLASSISVLHWLVIDTSTERFSRVHNMGTKFFFSKKFEIEFDLFWRAEINIQVARS